MTISQNPVACHHCSAPRSWSDQSCVSCGAPGPAYPVVVSVVAPKSAGLAVLLSFFWLGAGHLYANRTASGVALMIVDLLIVAVGLTGVGLVLAVPAWVVLAPIVMVLSSKATSDFNQRNGLVLR